MEIPSAETPLSAVDCYRFVLANPAVDICMMGARSEQEMAENLTTLDFDPLTESELERIKKIGDYVYGK
jgi:aryl-alcohol dehydrogenase-like predicted oxidoreductase